MKTKEVVSHDIYAFTYQHADINDVKTIDPVKIYDPEQLNDFIPDILFVFKEMGWDGGNNLGLIWLPPFFFDVNSENLNDHPEGEYFWIANNKDNSITYIAWLSLNMTWGDERYFLGKLPGCQTLRYFSTNGIDYLQKSERRGFE